MEILVEFIFEVIIDGAFEVSSDKKLPLPVRIISAIVLIGVFGLYVGLICICFYYGIHNQNWIMLFVGIIILIIAVLAARAVYKKRKS